jgi:hypothetical protein
MTVTLVFGQMMALPQVTSRPRRSARRRGPLARSSRLGVGAADLGDAQREALGHVELDLAGGQHVGPEQGRQAAEVFGDEDAGPFPVRRGCLGSSSVLT